MARKRVIGYSMVGVLAVLIGHGVATAQQGAAEGAPEPSAKQVNLSPAEQLSTADSYLSRMESIRSNVRRELEDARQQRDVVKTLCLNDKLNQLDVALRSATERRRGLELAAGRNDVDLANHEFTILTVLFQRAQQLDAEAKQCIGKEVGFVGESSVTMDIDPNLPAEDPSEYPTPPIIAEPPLCASCMR